MSVEKKRYKEDIKDLVRDVLTRSVGTLLVRWVENKVWISRIVCVGWSGDTGKMKLVKSCKKMFGVRKSYFDKISRKRVCVCVTLCFGRRCRAQWRLQRPKLSTCARSRAWSALRTWHGSGVNPASQGVELAWIQLQMNISFVFL